MKNIKLLIILTIIFFIPFCIISGIKGFICGINYRTGRRKPARHKTCDKTQKKELKRKQRTRTK